MKGTCHLCIVTLVSVSSRHDDEDQCFGDSHVSSIMIPFGSDETPGGKKIITLDLARSIDIG